MLADDTAAPAAAGTLAKAAEQEGKLVSEEADLRSTRKLIQYMRTIDGVSRPRDSFRHVILRLAEGASP
jgi:hypothetical protein